jgi:hypothetical protein
MMMRFLVFWIMVCGVTFAPNFLWAQAHRSIDFSPTKQEPRAFLVVWSQSLTREAQLQFRKINRFTPLVVDTEKV